MNLTRPAEVRQWIDQADFEPKKALGQNFLVDRNILNILIDAAQLSPGDGVLEIGPGLGVVTEQLVQKAEKVIAVEKDQRLFEHLSHHFADTANLQLIEADVMDLDPAELMRAGINKLVANLPYSCGTRVMIDIANLEQYPEAMVVTVQKDVAERLAATHGNKTYGTVSVLLQSRYEVTLKKVVSGTCFVPRPRVESAIVVCRKRAHPLDEGLHRSAFHQLVKKVFLERRKQLKGTLHRLKGMKVEEVSGILEELGIDGTLRPEAVSVPDWCRLTKHFG